MELNDGRRPGGIRGEEGLVKMWGHPDDVLFFPLSSSRCLGILFGRHSAPHARRTKETSQKRGETGVEPSIKNILV